MSFFPLNRYFFPLIRYFFLKKLFAQIFKGNLQQRIQVSTWIP